TSGRASTSGGAREPRAVWRSCHAPGTSGSQTRAISAGTLPAGARVAHKPHPGRGDGVLVSGFALRASDGAARAGVLSPAHGQPARFTPELAAQVQVQLGSDIAMCLDVCPPAQSPHEELAEAVRLTTLWAQRQHQAERAPGQLLFGIAQGAADPDLRHRSIDE